jgi:hypothetical protein
VDQGFNDLPHVGDEVKIEDWHERLFKVRQSDTCMDLFARSPQDFKSLVETGFFSRGKPGLKWRIAAESSAAGFPQLEQLLMPPQDARKPEDHWVKLLVVDVGAGSTDAGYFISSRKADGRLILNYLKPAATLDYAGEQLTEMLKKYYLQKRGRDMTLQEAETLKLNAPEEWKNQTFANSWRDRIAEYVGEYMFRVEDERRLGEPAIPGLKIVMTGGSGLVEGLDRAVRNSVVDALAQRGIPGNVCNRTEITELQLKYPADRFDRARRAV